MQKYTLFLQKQSRAILVLGGLVVWFSIFFLRYSNLQTADLGRFIVNGREMFSGNFSAVTQTNFYSYTHPTFKFVNHHWLFGPIVFAIYSVSGFTGLTIFTAITVVVAYSILLFWCYKKYGLLPAFTAGFLALPLITQRGEVRPEIISLLGTAIYFVVLERYYSQKHSTTKTYALLLGTQLVWQNTHLFFVFGLLQLFLFWGYAGITRKKDVFFRLGLLGGLSALLMGLNPNGLTGALMPFQIFKEYGYTVAENQTVLFMLKRFHSPIYYYELGLFSILVLITIIYGWHLFRSKKTASYILLFGTLSFTVGTGMLLVNRVVSLWALVSMPFFALLTSKMFPSILIQLQKKSTIGIMILSTGSLISLVSILGSQLFIPHPQRIGIGLLPGINATAEFIKTNNLEGPLFNNYDIGGYLIYHLYPTEKVFVDNRPEAYPVDFFTNEYIKPQENELSWEELDSKYNFNLIVFYRHDLTDWAQKFMIARVADENWIPIYVDAYSIIFIKNSEQNAEVILRFEIPKELFSTQENP